MLVRSEVLGQLVNTLTATSSNADISRTQNFFWIFYCISEAFCLESGVIYRNKFKIKNQSHSLSITEIINSETSSYLKV